MSSPLRVTSRSVTDDDTPLQGAALAERTNPPVLGENRGTVLKEPCAATLQNATDYVNAPPDTTPCDGALRLAHLGYHVVPEHEVDDDGQCSCSRASCRKPGKHPRTPNGYKDATRDEATIRAWWEQWPRANIGFDAGASGVAIIGPDAPAWLDELRRRGLPDTVRVQTGSGPGHEHYHYQRTADCPIERVCIPGQFDIMSGGNIIAPGSVTTGPYIALTELRPVAELPFLPAWAVEMLVAEVERKAAQNAPAPRPQATLTLSDQEILQKARSAANGHLFERLYDGDVTAHDGQDTSHSGADLALLSKIAFWARGDETTTERIFQSSGLYRPEKWRGSYRSNTLRKALSRSSYYEPPQTRPTITNIPTAQPQPSHGCRDMPPMAATAPGRHTQSDPTSCVTELARIAELEQALATERERRITAEQQLQTMMTLLNNPSYTPQQTVATLRAQAEFDRLSRAGKTPDGKATLYLPTLCTPAPVYDEDGEPVIDEKTGEQKQFRSMAPATISKALKEAAAISKAFAIHDIRDPNTGKTRLVMENLRPSTREVLEAAGQVMVYRDRSRGPGRGTPKDRRLATIAPCEEHPDADVIIKSYAVCAAAGCAVPLGNLPDERITSPFQTETVTATPCVAVKKATPLKRRATEPKSWQSGSWQATDIDPEFGGDAAPFLTETDQPAPASDLCRDCRLRMFSAEEQSFGRHAYDCMAQAFYAIAAGGAD